MSKPDFDVGDLVVCVDDGPHRVTGHKPNISRRGLVVRVAKMLPPEQTVECEWGFRSVCALTRQEGRLEHFAAYRFRKIDKADDSFAEMLAACKPKELTR